MELQEIMRYIVSVCGFIPTHIHGQTLVVSRKIVTPKLTYTYNSQAKAGVPLSSKSRGRRSGSRLVQYIPY